MKDNPWHYGPSRSHDLQQILALQQRNLPGGLSEEERQMQGFVTVQHDLALLRAMNDACPHTIAKDGNQVIGYALTMLTSFREQIPVLMPMFAQLDQMTFEGNKLAALSYVVMGQVCVAKPYRGQGVMAGMYQHMRERLHATFDMAVTEVDSRNRRSLKAHQNAGFQTLLSYMAGDIGWEVLVWDWR